MPKIITFDKGSKRRVSQIRWKLIEILSLMMLAIFVFAMSLLVLLWELRHVPPYREPSKVPSPHQQRMYRSADTSKIALLRAQFTTHRIPLSSAHFERLFTMMAEL